MDYADGQLYRYYSSSWQTLNYDAWFTLYQSYIGTLIWNPQTATEALTSMAVCSQKTYDNGAITFYVSDDGSTWVEIADEDTLQDVNFDSTNVYLKAVFSGYDELIGVAYGGY
jgi:hypothetical protein